MGAVSPEAKARKKAYNKAYAAKRRKEHPEKIREWQRAYEERHRLRLRVYRRERMKKWREADPERARAVARKGHGVPEPTRAQPDGCECCGKATTKLVVDHDHLLGTFRGWLCSPCNWGLGHFEDSIERLMLAKRYLLEHR